MLSVTVASIHENLHKAYPNDTILVQKYTSPGGATSYPGNLLLNVQLVDEYWLCVYKLSKSSGPVINSAEVERIAFPFVYDTRNIRNNNTRLDKLEQSLADIFPDHNVCITIFGASWGRYCNGKGSASFRNQYGADVDIILT